MTTFTLDDKSAKQLSKNITGRYEKCYREAAEQFLSRSALGARNKIRKDMPSHIDKPTPQTVKAVRAEKVRQKSIEDMEAITHLTEWASDYLKPNVEGGILTELNNQSPILVPNITNLNRPVVKRVLKKLINPKGNVRDLSKNQIRRILDITEWVFRIEPGSNHPWLEPGIYFRNKQRNGRGKGLFQLFQYQQSTERKPIFPFQEIALEGHIQNRTRYWDESVRKTFAKKGNGS